MDSMDVVTDDVKKVDKKTESSTETPVVEEKISIFTGK
jgi:hypothetical protein